MTYSKVIEKQSEITSGNSVEEFIKPQKHPSIEDSSQGQSNDIYRESKGQNAVSQNIFLGVLSHGLRDSNTISEI